MAMNLQLFRPLKDKGANMDSPDMPDVSDKTTADEGSSRRSAPHPVLAELTRLLGRLEAQECWERAQAEAASTDPTFKSSVG